ncbi:restriction endonuclease [Alcaligenes nematophilus]|uniref:restriction endonuclease n=1 Tax=Alcaligenes nematophilus TaxID=2994643 RepID=UPI00245BE5C5|nr:restriction endonuclease [Alcaligenes nematophilus]MDH4866031.1 restriction endonuclease [Bacillus cereus]MDY7127330.1 restriction endonuclease [Alcaligenes nematophilus]
MSIEVRIYSREMDKMFSDFDKEHENIFLVILDFINKDVDVLVRKKRQALYKNDYGNYVVDKWIKELNEYVSSVLGFSDNNVFLEKKNLFLRFVYDKTVAVSGLSIEDKFELKTKFEKKSNDLFVPLFDRSLSDFVWLVVDNYENKSNPDIGFEPVLGGVEYELECEKRLVELGWSVVRRGGSGDQGVDLIGEFNGEKVVFQCKFYSTPVGNAAVQEVIAGMKYEGVNTGVVLTNSSFTIPARRLANVSDVVLLHHDDLANFTKFLTEI